MSEECGKSAAGIEPQASALAVWSLVCGTFFFLPPLGLLALVLSAMARRKIRRSQGQLVGYRIAGVGWWLAIASLVFAFAVLMALPLSDHSREVVHPISCRSNLKQIGFGIGMYNADHTPNGRHEMPPDLRTLVHEGYVKCPEGQGILLCPEAVVWREPYGDPEMQQPQPGNDYVYARLIEPDNAPADAPIMWDKYLHTGRDFWHWKGGAHGTVNVLQNNLMVTRMPIADLEASLVSNRALYESVPPLPVLGGMPRGWSAREYAAAAATAFYPALILVALFRRRWLYALLPDRPSATPSTQALTTGLPTE